MISKNQYIDLKEVLSEKRFQGLWMLMSGYQSEYMGAMIYQDPFRLSKVRHLSVAGIFRR